MGSPVIDWAAVDAASAAPTRRELASESLACLGAVMCLNGLPIPAITAGTLVLLSAVDSPLLRPGTKVSSQDVYIALTILHGGKDAVSIVQSIVLDSPDPYPATMQEIVEELDIDPMLIAVYLRGQFGSACRGFETIPSVEGDEVKPFSFDSMWLAYYTSRICPAVGAGMGYVIWELPLVMGGYLLAQLAIAAGVKGVGRPCNDKAALMEIDRQMEVQNERE
jgi:hypothetical protein